MNRVFYVLVAGASPSGPANVSSSDMRPVASTSPASKASALVPSRRSVTARNRNVVPHASTALVTRMRNSCGSARSFEPLSLTQALTYSFQSVVIERF